VSLLHAALLGIVQGLTEFLPISSTAHLRIVPAFAGWEDPGAAFTAVTQLGTMAAVLIYFRRDLLEIAVAWLAALRDPARRSDPNARMEYKLPFLLSGGAALRLGKVQVEANARWYGKVNEFDLYSSDSVGIALAQVEGGPPVRETVTLEPVPMAFGSIVNIFLGASMPVSQNWRVHLGFSTDQSPLTDTETIFREVNLIGGTAGVSFRISRVSGALGLGFQSGKSPTTTVGVEPTVVDTKLTVKTFQLLYSLAVTF